jgi:hypothetical protein
MITRVARVGIDPVKGVAYDVCYYNGQHEEGLDPMLLRRTGAPVRI